MKVNRIKYLAAIIGILLVATSSTQLVSAQADEIRESFDNESLQGWDHSEGVFVSEGALQVPPDNFAVRFTGPPGTSISFDFKRSGPGAIIVRYAISPDGEYALIIHDEGVVLQKGGEGPPTLLQESPWEGSSSEWQTVTVKLNTDGQQISIGDSVLITTQEETVLRGSGIGFWVEGEGTASLDNLVISGLTPPEERAAQGAELPLAVEEEPPAEPTPEAAGDGRITAQDLISELTTSQVSPTDLTTLLINLGLSAVLSYILSRVYVHWGSSLSNRRRFAANFILITVTTTFIIMVVRSSVALSLGLVGALSIVRFRSAVKEPEELAYLFFAIAIGIGLGDNQRMITVIALAAAILVLGILRLFRGRQADFNLHITVSSSGTGKADFESVVDTLQENCAQMKLIRFDETSQAQEISFLAEFRDMKQLKQAKAALQGLSDDLQISFLDNKGVW